MPSSSATKQSSGTILKTTTWGARLALLALVTLLVAGLSSADGKKHKLSKDLDALKGGHNGATVDVIIQFNQTPTDAHHQKVQNKGGVLKTNLDFIKGAHYSVPVESLDVPTIGRLSAKSAPMPKVDFREEVANVALPELLEQRGLSEGRYVANVVDGKGTSL